MAAQIQNTPLQISTGAGDIIFSDITSLNGNISDTLAQQLLNELSNIQSASQQALSTFIATIGKQYNNAIAYAIAQYTNTAKDIHTSELLSLVLSNSNSIISIDNSYNFSQAEQSLIKAYGTIQAAIDSIPALNMAAQYQTTTTIPTSSKMGQLAGNLVNKIGKTLEYLSAFLGQIAMTRAQEIIEKRAAKLFEDSLNLTENTIITNKNISITTSIIKDTNLVATAVKQLAPINVSLGQSKLIVNDSLVEITFGGEINPLSLKKISFAGNGTKLSLNNNSSLGKIFSVARQKNHDLSLRYINQLAAGHEFKEEGLGQNYNGSVTLQQGWQSLVDYAVVLNFTDFLLNNQNNNTLYLLNNKIWDIDYILQAVADNPDAIEYTGGKQRFTFWNKINRWNYGSSKQMKYNRALAQTRSNNVQASLSEAYNSTIVKTKLNLSLLNLI